MKSRGRCDGRISRIKQRRRCGIGAFVELVLLNFVDAGAFPTDTPAAEVICCCEASHGLVSHDGIGGFDFVFADIDFAGGADFSHLSVVECDDIFGDVGVHSLNHRVAETPDAAASFGEANAGALISVDDAVPVCVDAIDGA